MAINVQIEAAQMAESKIPSPLKKLKIQNKKMKTQIKNSLFLAVFCLVLIFAATKTSRSLMDIAASIYLLLFLGFFSHLGRFLIKYLTKSRRSILTTGIIDLYIVSGAIGMTIFWDKLFAMTQWSLPEHFAGLSLTGVIAAGIAVQSFKKGILETSLIFALFMTVGAPLEEYSVRSLLFFLPMTIFLPSFALRSHEVSHPYSKDGH